MFPPTPTHQGDHKGWAGLSLVASEQLAGPVVSQAKQGRMGKLAGYTELRTAELGHMFASLHVLTAE